jgi:phage terminase large subunit-like protein
MLYGGSRSGKTFLAMRGVIVRAGRVKSRHAVLRYRFNHIKTSVIFDTLPKVMSLCFPDLAAQCELNKTDWVYRLPNGSEVWFGGLDDKERTEKILGQEYSTIYLNECSQIAWASRNMAMTRLAENSGLKLRAWYDCNPPPDSHWTNRLFVGKQDPDTRKALPDPENYAAILMNPADNRDNLPAEYFATLEALPEKMRRRFLLGEFVPSVDGALWTFETLDKWRVTEYPELQRIVIGVDPSGCSGDEDKRSDEVGIVVAALGDDGAVYVLEDLSGRHGPSKWGAVVASAYDRWDADAVVAETNYGGAMVKEVIRSANARIPVREVRASRGKHVRAEPISTLYEQGKVRHAGTFSKLEDQLLSFTTAGYLGDRSPDRADAMIWAVADLFPTVTATQKPKITLPRHEPIMGAGSWMR